MLRTPSSIPNPSNRFQSAPGAFTLIELLVVVAIIAILASLLLPSLAKAKTKAHGIQCMSNHRSILIAWRMYSEDSQDRIPYSYADPRSPNVRYSFLTGTLDFDPANESNWNVEKDIARSPIWPYCGKSAGIFKCPADRSVVTPSSGPFAGHIVPRVRSMSTSVWVGGNEGDPPGELGEDNFRVYLRLGDFKDPGASKTWVFMDQREDSINNNFYTSMTGYPDHPEKNRFFWDFPASYHNRAGGLSFADGHSEIHRWRDARTTPPVTPGQRSLTVVGFAPSSRNRDITYLQENSTRTFK